jgi:hypothetical protein
MPAPAIDRRAPAEIPPVVSSSAGTWDGVDRRKKDVGPPTGVGERRAFGLRNLGADNAPYRHAGMKP